MPNVLNGTFSKKIIPVKALWSAFVFFIYFAFRNPASCLEIEVDSPKDRLKIEFYCIFTTSFAGAHQHNIVADKNMLLL